MRDSRIVTVILPEEEVDVNTLFRNCKFAIPECPPFKLSTGQFLHVYKCTSYNDENVTGDQDVEQEAFDHELNG